MMLIWIIFGAWVVIAESTDTNGTTGQCSQLRTLDNFDPPNFAGIWYVVAHIPDPLYASGTKCSFFNFIKTGVSLTNLEYHAIIEVSGAEIDWEGKLTPVNSKSSGKFDVIFSRPAIRKGGITQILTTDYDHYAIQWGCDYGIEYYKVLSRNPTLAPQYQKNVDDYFDKNLASIEPLIVKVDQQNCPKKN